jgi:hypothetical protein
VLTSIERKRQYEMAMEIHALQPRAQDAATAHASLTRQINELSTTLGGRNDVPAEVKTSCDAFKKDLEALAPSLAVPQGGRGGGRGAANESLITKIGQAKNGLMGGMVVGEQTTRAYGEVKAQLPKAVADLNLAIAKAQTLSSALAKYSLTLTVPPPVQAAAPAAPARKTSSQ